MNEWLKWQSERLHGNRMNKPTGYIEYLMSQPRFRSGQLTDLPNCGIILHDTRLVEHLARLDIKTPRVLPIRTGTTDPNLLMHVMSSQSGEVEFVLNRGLPGGGGITTQAAELAALGVQHIVHIGTCAYMGDDIPSGGVLVSSGSYKDGTAALLSTPDTDGAIEPIARPDPNFASCLYDTVESAKHRSTGYTIESFYHQPEALIRALVENDSLPGPDPVGHLEMEQAGFLELGRLMGYSAASMTIGSDRYRLVDGELTHAFEDDFDQDEMEVAMIRACLAVFKNA